MLLTLLACGVLLLLVTIACAYSNVKRCRLAGSGPKLRIGRG
jgi:hypothetical protein